MCVRTCVCGHVCVCVCACVCVCVLLKYEWEIFFCCCCFVLSHTDASVSKSRSMRKRANVQRRDSPALSRLKHNMPPLSRVPPSYHHSAPSSQLAPQTPPQNILLRQHLQQPPLPHLHPVQTILSTKFRRHSTHTHMEVQVKRRATIFTSQH